MEAMVQDIVVGKDFFDMIPKVLVTKQKLTN
jgi:hypothetical protein